MPSRIESSLQVNSQIVKSVSGNGKDSEVDKESPKSPIPSGNDHGEDLPIVWRSWRCVKLIYIVIVVSQLCVIQATSLIFSSPLLDEMAINANSTPWVEGFDNCAYQSLIGPSVLIGAALGGLASSFSISLIGLVSSMVVCSFMFLAGWCMIGASWFLSTWPPLFRGLVLTGRFVTGFGSGWCTSSRNVSKYLCTTMTLYY